MSGHSKWATIKHKKGATDAKRGKLFTKLIKEITVATKVGGGGDPNNNPRLRKAIADAKSNQMPADTIKRAVSRGSGEGDGANYDEVVYEGTGPGGTLFLVEAMTDNRNRTVSDLRKIFDKHAGVLGSSGTANWAFDRRGLITLDKASISEDDVMEKAIGGGADDYADVGDEWHLTTAPDQLMAVVESLEGAKVAVKSSSLAWLPKNKKAVTGRDAEVCMNLAEALDDNDDVQNVYADFDVSDDELARIAGS
jgi:YebC/PmpR family DNA-binding regulatory protein